MKKELPLPYVRICDIGRKAWRQADARLAAVKNIQDLLKYQKHLKSVMEKIMGPLPELKRTVPFSYRASFSYKNISIRQVGLVSDKGYRITGWTFVRKGLKGKLPGLVVAAGHDELGSLRENYLNLALYAAECGFYVFSFDPPGQGARREVFLEKDHPVYWSPCNQHQHMGAVTTLAGYNLTGFFMSDCLTAVSFLSQRSEVDSRRIGFTGQSGGGLQTYFAIAADPRITAAAPCQATYARRVSFKHVRNSDFEQTYLRAWSMGFDLVEMGALFAPKPLRIIAEFGCDNQVEVYKMLHPLYARLGFPENIELASSTVEHQLSRSCRENIMSWLARHLKPANGLMLEPEYKGFEKVREKMLARVRKLNAKEKGIVTWCQSQIEVSKKTAEDISSILKSNSFLKGTVHKKIYTVLDNSGREAKAGRFVLKDGKYLCAVKPGYYVPFSIVSGKGKNGVALLVDEAGASGPLSRSLPGTLKNKFGKIIAIDVFNCGRLRSNVRKPGKTSFTSRYWHLYGPDNHHAQDAFMAERCPIGLAVEEICSVLNSSGFSGKSMYLIGRGWPALSLLLLSASLKNVRACVMCGIPESFRMMLDSGHMILNYNHIVPGILRSADIPDIIKSRPNVRYAICAPMINGSPSVNYSDRNEFPNLSFYSSAGKSVITKAINMEDCFPYRMEGVSADMDRLHPEQLGRLPV
jgi:hypothetical protein